MREKDKLRTELITWEREKARLFAEAPGKYVLIKGDQVIGIYDTQLDGINAGWARFPHQPIFVHLIEFEEPRVIAEDHGSAVRVEIEWEDGTVQAVRGPDAERYMELEASTSFMAANHGMRFKPLPWEYRKTTGLQTETACGHFEAAPDSIGGSAGLRCKNCNAGEMLHTPEGSGGYDGLHFVAPFCIAAGDDGAAVLDASGSCVLRVDAIRVDVARFLCALLNSAAARQEK